MALTCFRSASESPKSRNTLPLPSTSSKSSLIAIAPSSISEARPACVDPGYMDDAPSVSAEPCGDFRHAGADTLERLGDVRLVALGCDRESRPDAVPEGFRAYDTSRRSTRFARTTSRPQTEQATETRTADPAAARSDTTTRLARNATEPTSADARSGSATRRSPSAPRSRRGGAGCVQAGSRSSAPANSGTASNRSATSP